MLSLNKALVLIFIIAIVTFFTRVLPFLAFPGNKKTPAFIEYLGRVLPFSVMGMLVIYCLKSINMLSFPFGLPELLSVLLVVIIHKWKHQLLFSIVGGTVCYMVLIQAVFI